MKPFVLVGGLTLVVLITLLLTTNPLDLSAPFLIIPFALIFVTTFCGSAVTLKALADLKGSKLVRLSLLISGLPLSFLLLQSIGQLTMRDAITLLVLFALAVLYVSRLNLANP